MNFNELSYEIVMLIFENFTHKQLSHNVAPVCKQWRLFAYDPCLWKKVKLNGNCQQTSSLKSLFDRSPLLTEFTVYEINGLTRIIPYFANCPCLRKLHLSYCDGLSAKYMVQLVRYCPLVDDFCIRYCPYFDPAIMNAVMRWNNLKNIGFSYLNESDSPWDNDLVRIIANKCENVECAELDFHLMTDSVFRIFLNRRGFQLRKLHANLSCVSAIGTNLLLNCPLLTDLSLNYAVNLSETDLLVVTKLNRLRSLRISRADLVTSSGMCNLFWGSSLSRLSSLTISDCEYLDDIAVDAIAQCCPALKYLNITLTRNVTDVGVMSISRHCRHLETLCLDGIFNITKKSFMDIPSVFPTLKQLTMVCCKNITKSVINRIKELNPNLDVCGSSCLP